VKRGDIVIIAPPGPFNKPRPALLVQAHIYDETENVTVALITSDLSRSPGLRIRIDPTQANGLRKTSEVMIDHLQTVPVHRIGSVAGEAEPEVMRQVSLALRLFLGLQ
jgi:mRNA interferase MazF